MTSHENRIIQHLKDVISEPTPTQIAELLTDAVDTIRSHPTMGGSPPTTLASAMQTTSKTPQIVALNVVDMVLIVAVIPTGDQADHASEAWRWIRDRLVNWRTENRSSARHFRREAMPPGIAGVMLREPGNNPFMAIRPDLPHKGVIEIARAMRLHTIGAMLLAGGRLLERAAHRHPVPAGLAAAATVLTVAVPVVRMIPDDHPGGLSPVYTTTHPPAAATVYTTRRVTVTAAAPTITVTQTATDAAEEAYPPHMAISARPARQTVPPAEVVPPQRERSTGPRHRHTSAATVSPSPVSSPTPSPAPVAKSSPTLGTVTSSRPSASPAEPVVSSGSAAPTEPDEEAGSMPAQHDPVATGCGGIGLDVDLPPLADVDVCVG